MSEVHDPFDVRSAQARDADRRHEMAIDRRVTSEDWIWLLRDQRGRRIMTDLLGVCGVDRPSYTGSAETYYREGRRSVGLHIQQQARQHAPAHYLELIKEALDG
jgi:hypothetical protein